MTNIYIIHQPFKTTLLPLLIIKCLFSIKLSEENARLTSASIVALVLNKLIYLWPQTKMNDEN